MIRGLGPSIGINGTLDDPQIALFRTTFTQNGPVNEEIGKNDDWEDSPNNIDEIISVSERVGATVPDSGSKDATLLVDVEPGLYSFILSGVDSGTGIGLVEVFLAD